MSPGHVFNLYVITLRDGKLEITKKKSFTVDSF